MLSILRLNFTQSAIGNFLKFVIVSIKIKRQTTKKDPHHNRSSLNLLLIQQKASWLLETKNKIEKETTEKEGEGGTRETSPEPCE